MWTRKRLTFTSFPTEFHVGNGELKGHTQCSVRSLTLVTVRPALRAAFNLQIQREIETRLYCFSLPPPSSLYSVTLNL